MEEIRQAIFGLNPEATAGPDGFTAKFFQFAWDVIKDDLLDASLDFFQGSPVPISFSATNLVLIPKIENPKCWKEFRPISLTNVTQKLLSKILNDRLAGFLPNLVAFNQTGFLKDRNISDNILLAQEMTHDLFSKVRGGIVIFKLDMMKAYDKVNWEFTFKVLKCFGFNNTWLNLVNNSFKKLSL